MVFVSAIPREVSEALEAPTFSLHIKGDAGTGKTTMALEQGVKNFFNLRIHSTGKTTMALELVRYLNCSAIYLSTHISPSRVYNQFHGLKLASEKKTF